VLTVSVLQAVAYLSGLVLLVGVQVISWNPRFELYYPTAFNMAIFNRTR
jgi:hypothetical protein